MSLIEYSDEQLLNELRKRSYNIIDIKKCYYFPSDIWEIIKSFTGIYIIGCEWNALSKINNHNLSLMHCIYFNSTFWRTKRMNKCELLNSFFTRSNKEMLQVLYNISLCSCCTTYKGDTVGVFNRLYRVGEDKILIGTVVDIDWAYYELTIYCKKYDIFMVTSTWITVSNLDLLSKLIIELNLYYK